MVHVSRQMESENLLQEVQSFVVPSKGPGGNVNILERTKSAIVLMRCLPCARAAVLEQIRDIFQEAVHKHIIESDRQDLLGSGEKAEVDPEIYDVIQSIHNTLLEFINNNPDAWAPIVTKWSVYLLGQLSAKYATQRGTKTNTSLNEKLQIWLTCPAAQMLMEISAHCFTKLINTNPDICIKCLLDSAVQHSPHFDWVVAYIGSYFHKSIISHLLACAMDEFYSDKPCDDEFSDLFQTAIRILDYFAQKYPDEVRKAVLAMFQESIANTEMTKPKWTKTKTQPCLIPFFIQLGVNAANILNVIVVAFLEQLTPDVMQILHRQLRDWGSSPGNHPPSLLSSIVGLVISLKHGSFKTFQFFLAVSAHTTDSTDGVEIQNDIRYYSALILEKVFISLHRLVTKNHRAEFASADGKGTGSSANKDSSNDIPFLNELKEKWRELCDEMLKADGQRSSWYLRLLSLVAIYSGTSACVEIFNYIVTFKPTGQNLSLYVELQKEVQAFYPRAPDLAVSKCLKRISIKSSPNILTEVQTILENFYQLMKMEKIVGQDYAGFSVGRSMRQHTPLLVSFLPYPNKVISSVTLDLLIALGFPFIAFSVSEKIRIVKTCVNFFFKLLHQYNTACQEGNYDARYYCLNMLKKYQVLLSIICRDEPCQILAIRYFMEDSFHQENKMLFCKHSRKPRENEEKSDTSLFDKNITPGISSRLPLNTASVFYLGVIGKGKRSDEQEILQIFSQSNSQIFLQCIHTICHSSRPPPNPGPMEPHNVKIFGTLAFSLRDLMVLDGSFDCNTWPDEDTIKYSIERDVKLRKLFDESEIFWHLLFLLAEVPHVLLNCLPIIHGLFSSILKFWEQSREPTVDCPSQLYASVQMMSIFRKAMWLPRPLCFVGDIFHIISPKEIHKLLGTIWEFFKENPPTVNTRIITEIQNGRHKNVVKSIFLGNIAQLGHLYARFFPVHDRT
ncbi:integrator complex subunit 5-like [Dendronephthya gigantea]|uniref:integrator complex subunit 5-like n=1 Tax=Dendronephthya gigantea TaxID=151771 RepID=UPI00106A60D2|nr:integrator complex subunit 5-like [Dendronephthya gigantea]